MKKTILTDVNLDKNIFSALKNAKVEAVRNNVKYIIYNIVKENFDKIKLNMVMLNNQYIEQIMTDLFIENKKYATGKTAKSLETDFEVITNNERMEYEIYKIKDSDIEDILSGKKYAIEIPMLRKNLYTTLSNRFYSVMFSRNINNVYYNDIYEYVRGKKKYATNFYESSNDYSKIAKHIFKRVNGSNSRTSNYKILKADFDEIIYEYDTINLYKKILDKFEMIVKDRLSKI